MKKVRSLKKRIGRRLLAAVIIITICVIGIIYVYNESASLMSLELNTGWTVSYRGKVYGDVDLYTFRLPDKIRKGDTVILDNVIPLNIGGNKAMIFKSYLSTVTVYINRRVSYVYMNDRSKNEIMPGNGLNAVTLPDNARGSECQVILTAGEDDAFRALPVFYFVDAWNGSAIHMNMYMITCLVGFFESILGVIMLCAAAVILFIKKNPARVFTTGLMSFAMGIWSLYMGDVLGLFSSDFTVNTQVGYVCLYFALIPFTVIIVMVNGISSRKARRAVTYIGLAIPVVFFTVACALNLSGRAFVSESYRVFPIVAILSVGLLICSTVDREKEIKSSNRIIRIGIYVLFAGIAFDAIRFLLRDRIIMENRLLYRSIIPYMSLAFILIMLYSYLVGMSEIYMRQADEELLHKIAYTDALTGLGNRAFCRTSLERMAEQRPKKFTIMSLDVNGLKRINDSLGHLAGDQLICDCADILSGVFENEGVVIRMGGDEFVVILDGVSDAKIRRLVRQMEKMEESVSAKRQYDIRISYGIASSDSNDLRSPEEIYKEADDRMYEMKRSR